jgi:hypothetical protein
LSEANLASRLERMADADVLVGGGDFLDDEERERLHCAIRRGVEDVEAGRTIDARTAIDRLRARAGVLDARKTLPR